MVYQPIQVETLQVAGIYESLLAMRLPKESKGDSYYSLADTFIFGDKDKYLASRLIKGGDEHGKFARGIQVWARIKMQLGWMIEFVTYNVGMTDLSTTSSMHNELKTFHGTELAEEKQRGLPYKEYTRIFCASYQTLRRIYLQRKGHKHPDWKIFLEWIETLPYFDILIYPDESINT